jgi:hypothetical protein
MSNKKARLKKHLEPTELLLESETWPTSLIWPAAIDIRLERLLDAHRSATTFRLARSDMVAALIFKAPMDGSQLEQIVKEYRQSTVGKALPGETNSEGLIVLPQRRPGRSGAS